MPRVGLVMPVQPLNADGPMLVTLLGIVTLVMLVQLPKRYPGTLVLDVGMVRLVSRLPPI